VVQPKPDTPATPGQDKVPAAEPETSAQQDQDVAQGESQEPPAADTQAAQDQPETEDLPDPTETELRRYNSGTRKRIQQLLTQRNTARQELAAIQPELQAHRQLRGYLDQHQLAPNDVNMLLGVGAALRRGDYRAFLEGVTPYVFAAQEAIGVRIAPDIQRRVEDGSISEDAARELTRTRYRASQAEHRLNEQTTQVNAQTADRNTAETRSAVDNWEANIRTRDPDYSSHKADAVRRYAQGLMQERGLPASPQQAVALVQTAYDEVNRMMKAMQPRPQPTRLAPSGIQVATGGPPAEPRNMKEAALAALQNMRRAS
jgi:hypothetical protein